MNPFCAPSKRSRPRPVALVTAALLLLLSACADSPEVAENSTADEPATSAPADSDDPGATAPTGDASTESELLAFSAETVGGDQFNGAELAGEPVALWFWAPW